LALAYAGWVAGIGLFLLSGLLTNYTGKLLARIMAQEPSVRTYADIGAYAFGARARLVVSAFFCLELWAVATALVILFGDSTHALVQAAARAGHGTLGLEAWAPAGFKALGLAIVLPSVFLPLRFLSPISVVGIVSIISESRCSGARRHIDNPAEER
jgi:vesicular inhibitory amino acid transporter